MDEKRLRIAIEGCCHGELDSIYESLIERTVDLGQPLPELLIICGDFQSIRNSHDLKCISIPPKYQKIGDFADYYTGQKKAPVLTVFIGGNHELSNYLDELKFGGWVAPSIYFLGHSGVIWYKGVRISGISGIWNPSDFNRPRIEIPPYEDQGFVKSAYHVRKLDFIKQYLIRQSLSVMISHDWPKDIAYKGNLNWLLKNKPFFKKDIDTGRLGSVVNKVLMDKLRPHSWFSAHLHVKYEALVDHEPLESVKRKNSTLDLEDLKRPKVITPPNNNDEIMVSLSSDDDDEDDEFVVEKELNGPKASHTDNSDDESDFEIPAYEGNQTKQDVPVSNIRETSLEKIQEDLYKKSSVTEFLALDKCLPRRKFLEFKHVPITSESHPSNFNNTLYHDKEFIAITRAVQKSFTKTEFYQKLYKFENIFNLDEDIRKGLEREIDLEIIKLDAMADRDFEITADQFVMTAEPDALELKCYSNPQTVNFEKKFDLV